MKFRRRSRSNVFAAILWLMAWPELMAAEIRSVLLTAQQVTDQELQQARDAGLTSVVLQLTSVKPDVQQQERTAAEKIAQTGLKLDYWIEIARCPELADVHPEWMASLQGHPEWRRFFPDAPLPAKGEVIKNYPWVPILYQEAFDAHRNRVAQLLTDLPPPSMVYLNGLQGAPSACGCGNSLCRWTADYGPILTATRIKANAAVSFVKAVEVLIPHATVIPVWLTECEKHDCTQEGLCSGVGCFDGICWKAWEKQLTPLARHADLIGVFAPYKQFQRDLPLYGGSGAWVSHCVKSFAEMPVRHGGKAIAANRLVTAIQAWDVTEQELNSQLQHMQHSGAAGYVLIKQQIDQSWSPLLYSVTPPRQ
ncbi:MAG: hypothetical protein KDA81_14115 [Planctomycetaceae bacterium]|nr:hypothetical protein [Planctomycetaceae bacterium]